MSSKKKKSISRAKKSTSPSINLFKQNDQKKDKIYLDANATTPMCSDALKSLKAWANCGNPSSESYAGIEAKELLEMVITKICKHCGISRKAYTVLFTPSASASNSQILQATSRAYKSIMKEKPHFITSSIEHKSLLNCINHLHEQDDIDLTFIEPDIYGRINPVDIERAIKPKKTALISIMAVNNELGSKNDIRAIGNIAKKYNIIFHCDAVQLFGKEKICMSRLGIDALSASFHKFYGPKGLGLLILSNNLIRGYQLKKCPIIFGTQQQGLLGGTENVALIASGLAALESTFKKRKEKNAHLMKLTDYIINTLGSHIPVGDYRNYVDRDSYEGNATKIDTIKRPYELILLGPPRGKDHSPNTLLLSIVKHKGPMFCNRTLKKALFDHNVIVSIGSACNTNNNKTSHVINAISAPDKIKKGIVRISLNDYNTKVEIDEFIKIFLKCIGKQIPGVDKPRQKKKFRA